jgi:regulator of cell morphogenesis and NO signaling
MRSYKRDGNNRVVFSKDMTLVELIDADYTLLTILQRMGIELPFGDITIEQLCCKYGTSVTLFLMICQIYACADYEPEVKELQACDLQHILRYLRASHHYYLESLLPSIERGVVQVLDSCDPKQSAILRKFYADYAEEVRAHLRYEESVIFPYVESLMVGDVSEANMASFMAEHTDVCDKVNDIKSIVIKYLPESCTMTQRCNLLHELYVMRDDLAKHTLIELKLLTPISVSLERRMQQ